MLKELRKKILNKKVKIGIIGLGYVGLPLAITFAKKGFKIYGIDIDEERIGRLNKGESYILDVLASDIIKAKKEKALTVTTDFSIIKELDAVLICVPTPLHKTKEPDVSYIVSAVENIKKYMKRGQIVVLESTTYPGTTEEVMLPILESTGLKEGKDFYLAFSPERIDPGNKKYDTANTPKIIGGISKESTEIAKILYEQVIEKVIPVSASKVAEMVKLLENTFRIVNIGLVNEIMLMCDKLGIDVWEVIDAAKTKPYGFMPFYPGPGVGGHCLGKDEYVYIKNEDFNEIKTVKISDFVRELEHDPASRTHLLGGVTYIKPDAKQALSYDVSASKPCFREVGIVSERPYDGEMVNVRTMDNRTFSVTTKHPVLVSRAGVLGIKFANELRINDEIPVMLGLPERPAENRDLKIDLIEVLQKDNEIDGVRVKGSSFEWSAYEKEMRMRLGYEDKGKIRDFIRDDYLPLEVYLMLEQESDWAVTREDLILVTGRGPSFQSVPAVIDIDEDFMRFIGYYLSEGCITVDKSIRTRLTFNSNETAYVNDILLFLKERGINYSVYKSKIWKSVCIKISSNIFGRLLRDHLGCGTNSYTMKIPERFLLLPKNLKMNLLIGILRGDGGVDYVNLKRPYIKHGKRYCHNNNTATVNYFTSSDILFNQVVLLLQGFGFVPTFKKRKNLLNMFGYEQLKILKDMFLGQKNERLRSYIKHNKKIIPNKTFERHKNFATTRIKEISSSKAARVYSMEVHGTNTFVTSFGILTHNCIPVDPIYLSWKARGHGFEARFIDLASHVNSQMPHYVVDKIRDGLNEHKKALKSSKILIIGVAYKKDVKDLRESPALEIINILKKKGALVSYYDPYLPYLRWNGIDLKSVKFNKDSFKHSDCVAIVTEHSKVDYKFIVENSILIVDTRNALKDIKDRTKIVRL